MINKNYRRAVDLFAVPFLAETALYWGRIDEQEEESSDCFLGDFLRNNSDMDICFFASCIVSY